MTWNVLETKGRIKIIQDKALVFVKGNRQLEPLHGKQVTMKVDNHYFFGSVIRYAKRYVIYIPVSEEREYLIKKGKFDLIIL